MDRMFVLSRQEALLPSVMVFGGEVSGKHLGLDGAMEGGPQDGISALGI